MKDNGKMIYNMDMVQRLISKTIRNLLACLLKVKKMDKVKYFLVMENILKDNFKTIISMDMGSLSGPMEKFTKENG